MNYYMNGASCSAEMAHNNTDYKPGRFGKVYIVYLQEHRRGFFNQLVTSNQLAVHVQTIEERAENKYRYLLDSAIAKNKIDENLKVTDIKLWKKKMESAKKDAELQTIKTVIFN